MPCLSLAIMDQVLQSAHPTIVGDDAASEAPPGFVLLSAEPSGRMVYANTHWHRYVAESEPEPESWLSHVHELDRPSATRGWQRLLRSGRTYRQRLRLRRHDGRYVWHRATGWIEDRPGRARLGWIALLGCDEPVEFPSAPVGRAPALSLSPVMRPMRTETAAQASRGTLSRAKEDFLTLVSHELRSPLNAIRGWVHVMRQATPGSDVFERAMAAIERNSAAQLKLVEDLLDSARIVAGTLAVQPDWTTVPRVLDPVWGAACASAKGRQLRCTLHQDPMIGQVRVDPRRVAQVAEILLSNALKFTPSGGELELRTRRLGHDFEITVADSGCGVVPAFLPYMFDQFRQADSSATRGQGGMGLGLFLARSIVERHGGRITAHSDGAGAGTTVTVILPRVSGQDMPPEALPA